MKPSKIAGVLIIVIVAVLWSVPRTGSAGFLDLFKWKKKAQKSVEVKGAAPKSKKLLVATPKTKQKTRAPNTLLFDKKAAKEANVYDDERSLIASIGSRDVLIIADDMVIEESVTLTKNALVGAEKGRPSVKLGRGVKLILDGASVENVKFNLEEDAGIVVRGKGNRLFGTEVIGPYSPGKQLGNRLRNALIPDAQADECDDIEGGFVFACSGGCGAMVEDGAELEMGGGGVFSYNGAGICSLGATVLIADSEISHNGTGIIAKASYLYALQNDIVNNDSSIRVSGVDYDRDIMSGTGIYLSDGSAAIIERNNISENESNGIYMHTSPLYPVFAKIVRNHIENNGNIGIMVNPPNWATIKRNKIGGNSTGVVFNYDSEHPDAAADGSIRGNDFSVSGGNNIQVFVLVATPTLSPGFYYPPPPADWEKVHTTADGELSAARYAEIGAGPNDFRGYGMCGFVNASFQHISAYGNRWQNSPPAVGGADLDSEGYLTNCWGDVVNIGESETTLSRPRFLVDRTRMMEYYMGEHPLDRLEIEGQPQRK